MEGIFWRFHLYRRNMWVFRKASVPQSNEHSIIFTQMVDGKPVESIIPKDIILENYKVVGNYRRLWTDYYKRDIPRLSSRKAESGDARRMQSRPSTTQHLPSHFLRFTTSIIHLPFIQLFIHQTYGHTFSVPNEPTKTKIHQICRQVLMSKIIGQSHFQLFLYYFSFKNHLIWF